MFRRLVVTALFLAVGFSAAVPASAGGLFVTLEPVPYGDSRFKDAVLVVRVQGCFHPEQAAASATAEGLVNRERKSIQLKLTKIEPGIWAVKQEWGSQGSWILFITGGLTETPRVTTQAVTLAAGGRIPMEQKKKDGKMVTTIPSKEFRPSKLSKPDVEKMLAELVHTAATASSRR